MALVPGVSRYGAALTAALPLARRRRGGSSAAYRMLLGAATLLVEAERWRKMRLL